MNYKDILEKINNFRKNPELRFAYLTRLGVTRILSDEVFLKKEYKLVMGRELNLDSPVTYNEKLQWLKLYDRKSKYTMLVDKYEVKKYVANIIGEEYIIPTIGVWDKFDNIQINDLPKRFVLKCTHDSGGIIVCKDKSEFDIKEARSKIKRCMKRNYFYAHREWPYKNVKPRIIAEKYIGDNKSLPEDYKFYTFNGKIDCVMVCVGREFGYPQFLFYDMNWNRLNYQKVEPQLEARKPQNFDEMIHIVEMLSKNYKQLRVDLYNVDGKIYFGELTLFNQSGMDTDITYHTDLIWGKKIEL